MFGRPGEGGVITSHRSSAASRQDHEQDALFAAAERKELAAQKFDEWVRFKDSFDRGLALFAKLDSRHCEVGGRVVCACRLAVEEVQRWTIIEKHEHTWILFKDTPYSHDKLDETLI